jgi:hypothetical protein
MQTTEAVLAIDNLLGTVGADLNTLRREARRLLGSQSGSEAGHLNFALALLSLVACEAAGFFLVGSKGQTESCRATDGGTCIIQFIERFFPDASGFRRVPKVLADDLRHELVHGFGSRNRERPFELDLFVAEAPKPGVELRRDAKALRVNTLLLADDTAAGLQALKLAVVSRHALAAQVAAAAAIRFPVQAGVKRQFGAFAAWHARQS